MEKGGRLKALRDSIGFEDLMQLADLKSTLENPGALHSSQSESDMGDGANSPSISPVVSPRRGTIGASPGPRTSNRQAPLVRVRTERQETSSERISLTNDVLLDTTLRAQFLEFAEARYAQENVLFWIQLIKLKV
jgi:hypothetical protein